VSSVLVRKLTSGNNVVSEKGVPRPVFQLYQEKLKSPPAKQKNEIRGGIHAETYTFGER